MNVKVHLSMYNNKCFSAMNRNKNLITLEKTDSCLLCRVLLQDTVAMIQIDYVWMNWKKKIFFWSKIFFIKIFFWCWYHFQHDTFTLDTCHCKILILVLVYICLCCLIYVCIDHDRRELEGSTLGDTRMDETIQVPFSLFGFKTLKTVTKKSFYFYAQC